VDIETLHQRLEALVYPVLSVRRSVRGAVQALPCVSREERERFFQALELITRTSHELGYNFCLFAPPALNLLPECDWHDWVLHIMARYGRGGVIAAIASMCSTSPTTCRCWGSPSALKESVVVLILVRCPHCSSDQVVKRGKMGNDKQRYLCQNQDCPRKTFILDHTYKGCLPEIGFAA
jgi:hypothetical protein